MPLFLAVFPYDKFAIGFNPRGRVGHKHLQNPVLIKPFPFGTPGKVALMAAPRVIIQGLRQSRLQRVTMNITDELKKIRIGFDEQGLVPASE